MPSSPSGSASVELVYLIVDDEKTLREELKAKISEEVRSACKNLELPDNAVIPRPVEYEDAGGAERFILYKNTLPDWVLIDQRLGQEKGSQLAQLVSDMGYPADVLLYTRAGSEPSLQGVGTPRYGKLRAACDRTLPAKIYAMSQEFLIKWQDPEYLRGLVLSRAVDVDIEMDRCILKFFSIHQNRKPIFKDKILGGGGIGLFRKLEIIKEGKRLLKKPGKHAGDDEYPYIDDKNITKVFTETRDLFAHSEFRRQEGKVFTFVLQRKNEGTEEFPKKKLQEYFLRTSRLASDLSKLSGDLESLGGEEGQE